MKLHLTDPLTGEALRLETTEPDPVIYSITYGGFRQRVRREFATRKAATSWLWRIGRPDLIYAIKREPASKG